MSTDNKSKKNRKRAAWAFGMAGVVILSAAAIHAYRTAYLVHTEDAYVQGNVVQVTSQIEGTVIGIDSDDTQSVTAGASLVRLNPVDYEVRLERAKAGLAASVRQVRVQFHQVEQLQAEVRQRQNDLNKATQDLFRRQQVAASGAVSGEEIQHAADLQANAREILEASRQQLAQRQVLTEGLTLTTHPDIMTAASHLKDAYIALQRTRIIAPVSGLVSKRGVQIGQRIAAGSTLMSIVPMEQLWVDANFQESQLSEIRVGQEATLTSDVYGGQVTLHGRVLGLDAGTGSAFALLPAQNATGNWIKVTQRLPVRIALVEDELKKHPLRLGLSMRVTIDTSTRKGSSLTAEDAPGRGFNTQVFDNELNDAEKLVQSIIAANATQNDSVQKIGKAHS